MVITARTEHEGEGRTEANSVRNDDPIVADPGQPRDHRGRDRGQGPACPADQARPARRRRRRRRTGQALAEWGHIDVLFNNAIFPGGATMDRIMDLTPAKPQLMHRQLRPPDAADPAGDPVDARAWLGPDHQHGLRLGPLRPDRPGRCGRVGHRLLGVEGRVRPCRRRHQGRVLGAGRAAPSTSTPAT